MQDLLDLTPKKEHQKNDFYFWQADLLNWAQWRLPSEKFWRSRSVSRKEPTLLPQLNEHSSLHTLQSLYTVKKLAFLGAGFCFLLFKYYHHISVHTKPIHILFLCFFCNHDLNNAKYKCWNRTWRKANKLTRCLISRQNQTEPDYSDQDPTLTGHNSQILPQPTSDCAEQEGR